MEKVLIDISDAIQFGDLLGSLMGSLVDAQTQAARATADYIMDIGTKEKDLSGEIENELNTVSFKYKKYDQSGVLNDFTLNVPLLSLVEIPAISVKTAKFSFYYEAKVNNEEKVTEILSGKESSAIGLVGKVLREGTMFKNPVKLTGKVNRETNTTSNITKNAGIKIDIEIEKTGITVGMEKILDMLELAAKEIAPPIESKTE